MIRALILVLLIVASSSANAGPISFFRRVFGSHDHPAKRQRVVARQPALVSPTPTPVAVNTDRPPVEPEATVSSPTAAPATESIPAPTATRVARQTRTDFPYALPVANKPGFVTSPYSPNGGYVDVRGFPSGTEVKDPYTGKIFITP